MNATIEGAGSSIKPPSYDPVLSKMRAIAMGPATVPSKVTVKQVPNTLGSGPPELACHEFDEEAHGNKEDGEWSNAHADEASGQDKPMLH